MRVIVAAEVEAAELETHAAKAVEAAAVALGAFAAEEGVAPGSPPAGTGPNTAARVAHPTPSVGLLRPRGSTVPPPAAENREA